MSRTTNHALRRLLAALTVTTLLAGCAGDDAPAEDVASQAPAEDATASDEPAEDPEPTQDESAAAFPATVTHDGGETTIEDAPEAIVSLSATSTEILFAIGAGDQVIATDSFSDFPAEAPTTDISAFDPNVEAILALEPDLVVASDDRNDLFASLDAAGVPALLFDAATTFDAAFEQFRALGAATGTDAEAVVADIESELDALAGSVEGSQGLTYYHELTGDLFSATSNTFIGEVYGLFGLVNIADEAAEDGNDYPQLSAEYIVESDPDLVFLADTVCCGVTPESFGEREAFAGMTAVQQGAVIGLDDSVASRWGPRMVDFAETVAAALADL